jgi:hypothetical protein
MGVEGLDTKYPRGKYPREAWPWDRPDPHDDVLLYNWARPGDWDGLSPYDGVEKLNTSIYELYVLSPIADRMLDKHLIHSCWWEECPV